jgi:putative tricarboxylic transport membrane protein
MSSTATGRATTRQADLLRTSTSRRARLRIRCATALLALTAVTTGCTVGGSDAGSEASGYPARDLQILAPGSTGGGWDTRARSIENALTSCDVIDQNVTVTNTPGAGGTIGLSDFVQHKGDPYQLMVMDTITMLGGIIRNDSPIDLTDLTPIAGLTLSPVAVVVPADSPYKSLDDLLTAIAADPQAVSIVGGSLGGGDHLLAARLAETKKVAAKQLNYVATGGGGEATSLLLSGAADAGLGTVTELRGQIEAGEMRALAVSGDKTVEGLDAPTLADLGLEDADVESIGGVLAPPGLSKEQQDEVVRMITDVTKTSCWKESLRKSNWSPLLLTGDEFGERIAADRDVVTGVLEDLGLTS